MKRFNLVECCNFSLGHCLPSPVWPHCEQTQSIYISDVKLFEKQENELKELKLQNINTCKSWDEM